MKMYNAKAPIALTLLLAVLLVSSCKKDDSSADQINATVAEATANEADLQGTFDDVYDNAAGIDGLTAGEDLGMYGETGFGLFSDPSSNNTSRCFTVNITPRERGVFPKTVVLDFGTGCVINGHTRKGKLITVYSGPLHKPGNKAVTSFNGYEIDGRQITGSHAVKNTTLPGSNQREFTRTIEAKVLNLNDQSWRSWTATTVLKQVEGNGSPLWPLDDAYQITGSRKGESSKGRTWTAEIINPLVKAFSCRWISKGIVNIRVNGTVGTLDYGNGTCDDEAVVTVNGGSKTIKLR